MKVTLGLLQHACVAAPAPNLKKTLALAEKAAKQGAQIICTQELFRSQYFCQNEDHANFKLAESIPGPAFSIRSQNSFFRVSVIGLPFLRWVFTCPTRVPCRGFPPPQAATPEMAGSGMPSPDRPPGPALSGGPALGALFLRRT